jgi:hypothetical protein
MDPVIYPLKTSCRGIRFVYSQDGCSLKLPRRRSASCARRPPRTWCAYIGCRSGHKSCGAPCSSASSSTSSVVTSRTPHTQRQVHVPDTPRYNNEDISQWPRLRLLANIHPELRPACRALSDDQLRATLSNMPPATSSRTHTILLDGVNCTFTFSDVQRMSLQDIQSVLSKLWHIPLSRVEHTDTPTAISTCWRAKGRLSRADLP